VGRKSAGATHPLRRQPRGAGGAHGADARGRPPPRCERGSARGDGLSTRWRLRGRAKRHAPRVVECRWTRRWPMRSAAAVRAGGRGQGGGASPRPSARPLASSSRADQPGDRQPPVHEPCDRQDAPVARLCEARGREPDGARCAGGRAPPRAELGAPLDRQPGARYVSRCSWIGALGHVEPLL
jgi:hypothetical protein